MEIKIRHDDDVKWYSMPDTWDELKLDTYMEVMKYLQDTDMDNNRLVMLIHHLTDIPQETLYKMSISDITSISEVMSTFLETKPSDELKHIIKIDGTKYGFHPRLRDISLGEFVDIEHCVKDGINQNLHTLLSVLYRPVVKEKGDQYTIEEYEPSETRANLFKNRLSVGDFNGASVFFYDLGIQLLDTMNQYLEMEVMRERVKLLKISGDGMKSSTT